MIRMAQRSSALLSWLSTTFQIDAKYFVKNSLIVTTGHGISVIRGIVTGYLVTRLMAPAIYGEYQFVQSLIGTLGVFTMTGLPTSIARSIARKDDVPLLFTLKIHTVITAFGAIALLCMIPFLSLWGRAELWPLLLIASLLYVPSIIGPYFFGGIVIGTGQFSRSLRTSALSGLLLIVSVLLMLFLKPSAAVLLALMLGIPAIVFLLSLREMIKMFPSREHSWKLVKYGMQLSFVTIPVTLSWYLDKLMISALFGLNQLALFSVALMIPEQIKVWAKELFPVSFSRQAHGEDSRARRKKITQAVGIGTIFVAIGILCYIVISPAIIPILFPLYPAHEVILLTNIAAITLITMPATLFPQYLEARGMIKDLTIANWLAAVMFTLSLLVLVPSYGLVGAVIARGVFRFIYAGYAAFAVWTRPLKG